MHQWSCIWCIESKKVLRQMELSRYIHYDTQQVREVETYSITWWQIQCLGVKQLTLYEQFISTITALIESCALTYRIVLVILVGCVFLWALTFPKVKIPSGISLTRSWMHCHTRFYLPEDMVSQSIDLSQIIVALSTGASWTGYRGAPERGSSLPTTEGCSWMFHADGC